MRRNGFFEFLIVILVAVSVIVFLLFQTLQGRNVEVVGDVNPTNLVLYKQTWGGLVFDDASLVRDEIEAGINSQTDLKVTLDFRIFEGPEYGQGLDMAFSSGEPIDAFVVGEDKLGYWYHRNQTFPLNDLLDQYGSHIKERFPEEVWRQVSLNGEILAIPSLGEATGSCIVVRKDVLDAYNLPLPGTIEELEQIASELISLEEDIIPISGAWWDFAPILCPALDIYKWDAHIIDDEKKMILTGSKHNDFYKYFQTLQKWYSLEYLDDDYLSANFEQMKQRFINGKTVFLFNHVERTHDWGLELLKIDPLAELTVIPELNGNGVWSGSGAVGEVLIIPESSQNKVELIRFLDWIYSDEDNYLLTSSGIEGLHYEMNGGYLETIGETLYQGVYTPLYHKDMQTGRSDRSPFWKDAYDKVSSVEWESDPLKGEVFLVKNISSSEIEGWFSQEWGKFLSGEREASEENYKNLLDWYFTHGGDELARDYYTQLRN